MKTTARSLALAACIAVPAFAQDAPETCALMKMDEVGVMASSLPNKTRSYPTKNGHECNWLDSGQKAVLTVEVRPAKLPKAELDVEAENLQKIYRTSVKAIEPPIGDGGFWLTGKGELYFRKGKQIVRIVMPPAKDAKTSQARTESVARLIETRLAK